MNSPRVRPWLLAALIPFLACSTPLGQLGEVAEETDGDGGNGTVPPVSERTTIINMGDRAIDILFVVDNSGSMGFRQRQLTESLNRGIPAVQDARGADLRIGFTTTDNGNPWCQGTGPEAGSLVSSSCRSRLSEFVFDGITTVDDTQVSCLDLCERETIELASTATHLDSQSRRRPWIEISPAGTNLVDATLEEAIECMSPMGISGCGFESPLESMRKAILRSDSPSDEMYGFLRPWAHLLVVFVTDELDCSSDDAWEEIFWPEGNRVFWGDSSDPSPTSAVCWNAGVQCENTEGDLGACNPQNYDVDGNVTDAAGAVMRSLTHFIEGLQAVEAGKAAYRPEDSVSIALVAGVPPGYGEGQTEIRYTRFGDDPDFVYNFGVDASCTTKDVGGAVPPVRLRTIAELFAPRQGRNISTICGNDYFDSDVLLDALEDERTGCLPGCLEADATPDVCDVVLSRAVSGQRVESLLPACQDGVAPDGADACFVLHADPDSAAMCGDGSNALLEVVLAAGATVQGQWTVDVACDLADASAC
ncbi:MAG: hypothetical protein K0V04_32620 [Deltaproteobacteria bacterium]|nr:hypothetical protein [Deltaproteobacteria bacterium]